MLWMLWMLCSYQLKDVSGRSLLCPRPNWAWHLVRFFLSLSLPEQQRATLFGHQLSGMRGMHNLCINCTNLDKRTLKFISMEHYFKQLHKVQSNLT
ncbi:hypothetical protein GGR54DRAFT_228807 [Hypoxylon sp. NC1633]|nr:hypothetical protein GGR54DRAFT_228807 [Hypoxylon sp. NC1633]